MKNKGRDFLKIGELTKQTEGHGGMDFSMDWRMIDCLRYGVPLDMDEYDAPAWSVLGPLSGRAVAYRGETLNVPDFTRRAWRNNTL